MKNLTVLILIMISPLIVFSQWNEINVNQPNDINSVKFNNNTGLILGNNDSFKKTYDNGESWQPLICNIKINVRDFLFIEDSIIIAVGYTYDPPPINLYTGKIIKSVNNGQTWDSIFGVSGFQFNSIYFRNNNIGYVLGFNCLYMTIDQGQNWILANDSLMNSLTTNNFIDLNSMYFFNDSVGIATAGIMKPNYHGAILKTYDSGQHWNIIEQDNSILSSIQVLNSDSIIIICSESAVLKSFNKGETWVKYLNCGISNIGYPHSVFFINENLGYSVNCEIFYFPEDPTGEVWIYNTTNGGISWEQSFFDTYLHNQTEEYLTSIYFLNSDTGFAVGKNRVMRINNASGIYTETDNKINSNRKLNIYPNPCNNHVNIIYNSIANKQNTIEITDINGLVLKILRVESNIINTIDLTGFSKGSYIIRLISNEEIIRRKLILY